MTEAEAAAREFAQTLVWVLRVHGVDALSIMREYEASPRVTNALGLWEWLGLQDSGKH